MVDETKQKIMDAALKVSADYGYKGATTRAIAEESGFNELTLFRKFKTKENLFNEVLNQNIRKIKKEIKTKFKSNNSTDPDEILRTLITDIAEIANNNAEFLKLTNIEKIEIADSLKTEFVEYLSKFLEKKIPNRDVEYDAMARSIYANITTISQTKYLDEEFDQDKAVKGYIENVLKVFAE